MPNTTSPYTRADAAIAVILAVITLLLSVGLLDSDQPTGSDDFAAYMSEGIAIAEGRLNEQTQLNALLHPSTRSFRADDGQSADDPIVYVWGLPLILAGVYRIAGFDRPTGYALIWYKLPGVFFGDGGGLRLSAVQAALFQSCFRIADGSALLGRRSGEGFRTDHDGYSVSGGQPAGAV